MHRGEVHRFVVRRLIQRRFRVEVADQRELREKVVHVLELAREIGERVQVFAAQLVVGKFAFA